MAKKSAVKEAIKEPKAKGAVAPEAAKAVKAKPLSLEERVAELEGDLLRICQLCGGIWGEPLASQALEIATRRQGRI